MGDRKYGLITEEDIQNIHVMSEYNFDNATESRSAAAGAAGGAAGAAGGAAPEERQHQNKWGKNEQTTANAL